MTSFVNATLGFTMMLMHGNGYISSDFSDYFGNEKMKSLEVKSPAPASAENPWLQYPPMIHFMKGFTKLNNALS